MTKLKAFSIHFTASALVVCVSLALIWGIWYPTPLFQLLGLSVPLQVLVSVNLALGPALFSLLYRPGRPHLLLRISPILLIQLAALGYGASVAFSERPCYMIYVVDRFEAVACSRIDPKAIALNEPGASSGLVYAEAIMPADPKEMSRLVEEVVLEGKPDIAERPRYWAPFTADTFDQIQSKQTPISELPLNSNETRVIDRLITLYGERLILVPLTANYKAVSLIMSRETLRPVGWLESDPWVIAERR